MKLILKIAAGVCVGILAALALINAPAWFEKARQESAEEDAKSIIDNTTPDIAIAKCGKPFYDGPSALVKQTDAGIGSHDADNNRDLGFESAFTAESVILQFYRPSKESKWGLHDAKKSTSNAILESVYKDEEEKLNELYGHSEFLPSPFNTEILRRLPCLQK